MPGGELHIRIDHDMHVTIEDALREMRERGLAGTSPSRLQLPGTLSREQIEQWRKIRNSRFFLVRNRGGQADERYACGRYMRSASSRVMMKPVYHEYFTCMCVNMPWQHVECQHVRRGEELH